MKKQTNQNKKKIYIKINKLKNQKGSITIFVLLSMIFFVIILSGAYIATINKQKATSKYVEEIVDNYNINENEVYNNIVNKEEVL